MDGNKLNVKKIENSPEYWKYDITAKHFFITKENINKILKDNCSKEIALLHIDLDGNDYWIWNEISVISPIILILEYNSVFGMEKAITVPYNSEFNRPKAHFNNLYWGASLKALYNLSINKGYEFIGCNSSGNNAYFIRKDKTNDIVKKKTLEEGFVISKYRESRDKEGNKTFISGKNRIESLKGLEIFNTELQILEKL
jgi:hypothetical protein